MYVCGVTPYDVGHLGHALVYVVQDTLRRWLEFSGNDVRHIQNITDIDDDMVRVSGERGMRIPELARQNHAIYLREMDALNVLRPDRFPLVSEHLAEIIETVSVLEAGGFAYAVDGHVFFDTSRATGFGALAGYTRDELRRAPRTDTMPEEPDHLKRDQLDFLLWKPSDAEDAMFPSPWGTGRPGWHIECSVMARTQLGDQIDIHGGGVDLRFPHHDCEIVQTEATTGRVPSVGHWVHNGVMGLDGVKMSKSLGNLVKVSELIDAGHSPQAVRLLLLSVHYREDRDFDPAGLASLEEDVSLFRRACEAVGGRDRQLRAQPFRNAFMDALDRDLDTPAAIAVMRELARAVASGEVPAATGAPALVELGSVLGLALGE